MRTIAVANQKGGCGKTTVSINLAACLADLGQRTLLVDMDPQGHCGVGLGVPEADIKHSVLDLLAPPEAGPLPFGDLVWQIGTNFDLLPATLTLAKFEPMMAAQANREGRLREGLAAARPNYDVVVIDCPPSLSLLTFNALCAADEALIPVEAGFFALHGLSRQLEVIESLQTLTQRTLSVRVLCNLYDVRTRAARKIVAQLREHFGDLLTRTVVNLNTKLKSAAAVGQPITEFDRGSIGFHDFLALARELVPATAAAAASAPMTASAVAAGADPSGLAAGGPRFVAAAGSSPDPADPTKQVAPNSPPAGAAVAATAGAALLEQASSISQQAEQLLADSAELVAGSVADKLDRGDPLAGLDKMTVEEKLDTFYGCRQTPDGVVFAVKAPAADSVFVAGDFNAWSPHATPLAREQDGRWAAQLPLAAGQYRYRLVIDGRWSHDPFNNYHESNPFGELNSVVEVQ